MGGWCWKAYGASNFDVDGNVGGGELKSAVLRLSLDATMLLLDFELVDDENKFLIGVSNFLGDDMVADDGVEPWCV